MVPENNFPSSKSRFESALNFIKCQFFFIKLVYVKSVNFPSSNIKRGQRKLLSMLGSVQHEIQSTYRISSRLYSEKGLKAFFLCRLRYKLVCLTSINVHPHLLLTPWCRCCFWHVESNIFCIENLFTELEQNICYSLVYKVKRRCQEQTFTFKYTWSDVLKFSFSSLSFFKPA